MARRTAATADPAPVVREEHVEVGPWDQLLMDLRTLSPVGFKIDWESVKAKNSEGQKVSVRLVANVRQRVSESHVYAPPHGIVDALLIELGTRYGQRVAENELCEVYRLTRKQIKNAVSAMRKMYPLLNIEYSIGVGCRVTGPLPPHVKRIAPQ